MSRNEIPTQILQQSPSRSRLADTRASLQRAQAIAEREWERQVGSAQGDTTHPSC